MRGIVIGQEAHLEAVARYHAPYRLQRVAGRLGVHDLHERARRLPREEAQP